MKIPYNSKGATVKAAGAVDTSQNLFIVTLERSGSLRRRLISYNSAYSYICGNFKSQTVQLDSIPCTPCEKKRGRDGKAAVVKFYAVTAARREGGRRLAVLD